MTKPTPADFNEQHRKFWQQRNLRIEELLEHHDIVRIAVKREDKKAAYVKRAGSEAHRIEIIRHQVNFDVELENIDEEFGDDLRARALRRANVKTPRGKMANGKSVWEIVVELLSSPAMASLNERDAWDALPAAVAKFEVVLQSEPDQKDPMKDKYSYCFRGRRKELGRGHFRNLRTKSRKFHDSH